MNRSYFIILKTVIAIGLLQFLTFRSHGSEDIIGELRSKAFINTVQQSLTHNVWASFEGEAYYKETKSLLSFNSKPSYKVPISLIIDYKNHSMDGRITVNSSEVYKISSRENDTEGSKFKVERPSMEGGLQEIGLRPGDLGMDFLHWDLVHELEEETVGVFACRAFLMQRPHVSKSKSIPVGTSVLDKKLEREKYAKVYISKQGYFPVKVEWFIESYRDDLEPNRVLEAKAPIEKNGINVMSALIIAGEGWITRIRFNEDSIKAGTGVRPVNLLK